MSGNAPQCRTAIIHAPAGTPEKGRAKVEDRTPLTDPRLSTINSIETAFDQVGVMFLDAGDTRDGGIGVRLKDRERA
jgi:hypothetical protein